MLDSKLIPPLYAEPCKNLASARNDVGSKLVKYLEETQKLELQPEFKTQCQKLDALRESLRVGGITPQIIQDFTDYAAILRAATTGIDLSPAGANIIFHWAGKSYPDPNFDILCLAFNIIAVISKMCIDADYSMMSTILEVMGNIKIVNTLLEHTRPIAGQQFEEVVSPAFIDKANSLFMQIQIHATVSQAYIGRKESLAARLILQELPNCGPDLGNYLNCLAHALYSDHLINEKTYGQALAYGREALRLIPPKLKEPWKRLYGTLQGVFQPIYNKADEVNRKVISDVVPSKTPPIPPLKPIPPIQAQIPEPSCKALSVTDSIKDNSTNEIETLFENIKSQANLAKTDIQTVIGQIPVSQYTQLQGLCSEFNQKRDVCNQMATVIQQLLNTNQQRLGPKYPQLVEKYNQYIGKLTAARLADQSGETSSASALNIVDQLLTRKRELDGFTDQLDNLINDIGQKIEGYNQKMSVLASPSEIMSLRTEFLQEFNTISSNIQTILGNISAAVSSLKTEIEHHTTYFYNQFNAGSTALSQGVAFYGKLAQILDRMRRDAS